MQVARRCRRQSASDPSTIESGSWVSRGLRRPFPSRDRRLPSRQRRAQLISSSIMSFGATSHRTVIVRRRRMSSVRLAVRCFRVSSPERTVASSLTANLVQGSPSPSSDPGTSQVSSPGSWTLSCRRRLVRTAQGAGSLRFGSALGSSTTSTFWTSCRPMASIGAVTCLSWNILCSEHRWWVRSRSCATTQRHSGDSWILHP
mmetsp:Transcript_31468/g.83866  ORF Transcript_31468/g.83866 Transcript_31468/m.83866 type:complete len:202 (+) Transcript_31468:131-736(+)